LKLPTDNSLAVNLEDMRPRRVDEPKGEVWDEQFEG